MTKLMLVLVGGMMATACVGDGSMEADDAADRAQESAAAAPLTCDDCDPAPGPTDLPLLVGGGYQEIRPFERRCSLSVPAASSYNVFGDIQPRGPLVRDVRVLVFQGTTKLVTLPVRSGGFSITLNRTNAPRNFPGSFVTCIKNPGVNTVSVDARGTIIAN